MEDLVGDVDVRGEKPISSSRRKVRFTLRGYCFHEEIDLANRLTAGEAPLRHESQLDPFPYNLRVRKWTAKQSAVHCEAALMVYLDLYSEQST